MDVRADDADIDEQLGLTFAKVGESPTVLEQSARLQAMIDAARGQPDPLIDPRTLPVRFSRLKAFALSAAHYHHWCQDTFKETLATRLGSGTHAALFENRDLVCYDGRRAGKAWDRFEKRHIELGAVILNVEEYREAMGMVGSIRRHDRAMALLFEGTVRERKIEWTLGSRACASTPDAHTHPKQITELKTARSTEPRWFMREAIRRHYHAQLSFYDQALAETAGRRCDEEFVVVVENVAPFNVVVLRLPDETREVGAKLCHLWFAQLLAAERANHYGGYVEADIELELPHYDHPPVELELDGKLITVD